MAGLILMAALGAGPAYAGTACTRDNPAPRPLPSALVPAARAQFGLRNAADAWVRQTTVIRCMDGKIWACNAGANLPCGKANTAAALPAGEDWCRQNPDSGFVPAYITGHDSVWNWRCVRGAPATTGLPSGIDAQGYLSAYWKILN